VSSPLRIPIRQEHDASRAVLEVTAYARSAGFAETPSCMIATAVSELVRNVLKYADRGELRLRRIEGYSGRGVEIEVEDRGPGIADIDQALADHFSSSGTLGMGLPGVQRLMDEFEIDSTPGQGTRVRAVKWI